MNNNLFYCQEKIAPAGSDWYYSLLAASPSQKKLFLALLTLNNEWQLTARTVHDAAVAMAKFAWWRQELANTFNQQQATHPATQLLLPELAHYSLTLVDLEQLLNLQQDNLQAVFYDTETKWQQQAWLQHNVYLLLAKLTGASDEPYLAALSEGLFLSERIIHLRDYLKSGEIPFSREALAKFSLEPESLWQLQQSQPLVDLLKNYAEIALHNLAALVKLLPHQQRKAQKILLRYAKLQRVLLQEIAREHFPVLTHKTALTPIRKLLLCL